jgi:alkyldihydroxyacetonephosphate synthase
MADDARYRHKWWGWGPEGIDYDMSGRTTFWPWIRRVTGVEGKTDVFHGIGREDIRLPERRTGSALEQELAGRLKADQVRTDDDDRLSHAFGRSYRDLVRIRSNRIDTAPDIVVYPESHEEVVAVVEACHRHGTALMPFGGGTNVVGAVEHRDSGDRLKVTLDLRRMNRLLSVDRESMTVELEAGMFGPQIEDALAEHGLALGHHPDSFVYSTLGGWIATRSAGSHSNSYGKIEDMVVAVRMVTPTGIMETRPYPAASHGPDWNRVILGSEGTLGVITSATLRVHPIPEFEEYRMLLFRSFEDGVQALHECVSTGFMPSVARLSDEMETELIFAAKPPSRGRKKWLEKPVMKLLAMRGYHTPAAVILGFEGPTARARPVRNEVLAVCKRHGAFDLGRGPGNSWKKSRYDVPYLRDYMMEYALLADAFETATVWSKVRDLYRDGRTALQEASLKETGNRGYLGCHLSHLYDTGACLYFTVGVQAREGSTPAEMNAQYSAIKAAGLAAFVQNGGTLSHHHAVGYEHAPWMDDDHSAPARRAFDQVKDTLDPKGIMGPGNLRTPKG